MSKKETVVLQAHHVAAAERILSKGDRVELVPGPNGSVKILHIKRQIVKTGLEADSPRS